MHYHVLLRDELGTVRHRPRAFLAFEDADEVARRCCGTPASDDEEPRRYPGRCADELVRYRHAGRLPRLELVIVRCDAPAVGGPGVVRCRGAVPVATA